jgi:hypothetical protein
MGRIGNEIVCLLVGLLLSVSIARSCLAVTRLSDDRGGSLGKYLLVFAAIRDSGERVMIDGSCFSACTLVTAMIPKERICVTERAMLGFHAGWFEDESGKRVVSAEGTLKCIRRSSESGSTIMAGWALALSL